MSEASESLREALAAAEAGDLGGLHDAVVRCVELCGRLAAAGRLPAAAELQELTDLHRRVLARALAHHDRLRRALEQAGRSRRAMHAYAGR